MLDSAGRLQVPKDYLEKFAIHGRAVLGRHRGGHPDPAGAGDAGERGGCGRRSRDRRDARGRRPAQAAAGAGGVFGRLGRRKSTSEEAGDGN